MTKGTVSNFESLESRVRTALREVRPFVQSDGGDVEFVAVDAEGVVQVRLLGACIGCPSSAITLTMGIERTLKERVPEVTRVVCLD